MKGKYQVYVEYRKTDDDLSVPDQILQAGTKVEVELPAHGQPVYGRYPSE